MENIGHVSWWARMFSLKSQIDAMYVRALGMQAENMARESRGEAMAYSDSAFNDLANSMDSLAHMMAQI